MTFSRRDFVKTSVLGAVAAGVGTTAIPEVRSPNPASKVMRPRRILLSARSSLALTTAVPMLRPRMHFSKAAEIRSMRLCAW